MAQTLEIDAVIDPPTRGHGWCRLVSSAVAQRPATAYVDTW